MACGADRGFKIGSGMHSLESSKKTFEIVYQSILQVRDKVGGASDRTLKALKAFLGYSTVLQCFVKGLYMSIASQERQVSFADHDIVGSRVVVQFLMPLFQEMAGYLFDPVAMHDCEYLVANLLPLAAPPHAVEHH